jgi:hypothetical protein
MLFEPGTSTVQSRGAPTTGIDPGTTLTDPA